MNSTYQHLCAYSGSVTNGVANVDTPLVNDGILTKQNGHAILPTIGQLLLTVTMSADANRALLNTPSVRYVGLPSLVPPIVSATVTGNPSFADFTDAPLSIPQADEVAIQATQDNAAAQTVDTLVLFGFGRREVPNGPRYRVRGTGAISATVRSWTSGAITMDTVLPAGIYSVVGLQVVGAGLFGARLIFPGTSFRPGCLAQQSVGLTPAKIFTNGTLGAYGEFDSVNTPNLEIYAVSANSAQVVYMDVVRLSGR